jgi:hypothetical protein
MFVRHVVTLERAFARRFYFSGIKFSKKLFFGVILFLFFPRILIDPLRFIEFQATAGSEFSASNWQIRLILW